VKHFRFEYQVAGANRVIGLISWAMNVARQRIV